MRVDDVERRCNSANYQCHEDESEEDVRDQPAVLIGVVCRDAEAVEAYGGEDEHGKDENNAEFGFVDSPIPSNHHFGRGVAEKAGDQQTDHASNEGSSVLIAGSEL